MGYGFWILNVKCIRVSFVYFEGVRAEFGYHGFVDSLILTFHLRHIKLECTQERGDLLLSLYEIFHKLNINY